MSAAPVDVLAVLDSLIEYHDTSDSLKGRNCVAARAAVAELIEADREFDIARAAFESVFRPATHTRRAVSPKHNDPVVLAYRAASERRAVALAIVVGGV